MAVEFRIGDCIEQMRLMKSDSVDCVVTSPPYWGLRDYGVEGQLGLEPTLAEHLTAMVAVFEEVRRVLKPEGTCWVNYGDCYFGSWGNYQPTGKGGQRGKETERWERPAYEDATRRPPQSFNDGVMKPKDLCMVPNRFAIAMQDAGWWVRSEIIWAKPNPMPESVVDRPATAHEKIFLFTKSARYFYDNAAVRIGLQPSSIARLEQNVDAQAGSIRANGGAKTNGPMKAVARTDKQRGHGRRHDGFNDRWDTMSKAEQQAGGRNLRNWEPAPISVWEIATRPFSEAHFATFPPDLAERCIKAGCPKGGMVLDPFGGAGTTGLVADRLQRNAILIELNPEYAEIAQRRIQSDRGGLLAAM